MSGFISFEFILFVRWTSDFRVIIERRMIYDVESEDRNHVEIGVNSSIGRGSLRDAAAGDDSKIDYLVQGRIEAAYLLTAMSEILFTTCTLLKIEFPKRDRREETGLGSSNMVYLVLGTDNVSISTSRLLQRSINLSLSKRLVPVGLGDDDQCIEDDFSAWRDLVCPELNKIFRGEDDTTVSTSYGAAVSEFRIVFHDQSGDSVSDKSSANSYANGNAVHDAQHPCRVNIAVTRELHAPASDRSCTHLEFDISGTGLA
ncbi:MFS transporter multidrug-resistance type transporter [Orobanche minor]